MATKSGVAVTAGFVVACTIAVGAQSALKSLWRSSDVKAEGAAADGPALTPIAEKVTAGVSNDDRQLRVVVATPDPMIIERLQLAGLMVYVDPKNRKSQAWAVRVPPLGRVLRGEKPDPHVTYVEVFGPGKDEMHLVHPPWTEGIEAAARIQDGTWYIEVGMPLRTSEGQPYAPGIQSNQRVIGLGLVTPDPPKSPERGGPGSGGYGGSGVSGGLGGYGGYPGRMGPLPPPGPGRAKPTNKPVKVWTSIELAQR
jgi:hypothetical protein